MDRHENERWGAYTEWTARVVYGLTKARSAFHDALDGERPVEIKACVRRAGQRADPGKYFVREANHRRLVDADGWYVFVVYDPEDARGPILNLELKRAAWLDTLGYAWTSNGSRRGETVIRPPWTAVMDASAVTPGEDEDAVADAVARV